MKILTLKDTVELMLSDDAADRLVAEYAQVRLRRSKLADYINDNDLQDDNILMGQYHAMGAYMDFLKQRFKDFGLTVQE